MCFQQTDANRWFPRLVEVLLALHILRDDQDGGRRVDEELRLQSHYALRCHRIRTVLVMLTLADNLSDAAEGPRNGDYASQPLAIPTHLPLPAQIHLLQHFARSTHQHHL